MSHMQHVLKTSNTYCHDFIAVLEIRKVRGSLFQFKADDPKALPEPVGPVVTLSEKLLVPVSEYPDVCMHHCLH